MVNLRTILFPSISNRQATLVIVITIAFLIPDTMIGTVSDFLVPQTTSVWGISFFILFSIVCVISQHLLLRFVWLKTKDIRSKSFLFNGLLKIVIASQYTLLTILIVIIYQILFMSQYYTDVPDLVNWYKFFIDYQHSWHPRQAVVLVVSDTIEKNLL